jgi:hypothetical protein
LPVSEPALGNPDSSVSLLHCPCFGTSPIHYVCYTW